MDPSASYSDNGEYWVATETPEDNPWTSIAYGVAWVVAVATSALSRIMHSEDGINWTVGAAPENVPGMTLFMAKIGSFLFPTMAPTVQCIPLLALAIQPSGCFTTSQLSSL